MKINTNFFPIEEYFFFNLNFQLLNELVKKSLQKLMRLKMRYVNILLQRFNYISIRVLLYIKAYPFNV